jgi:hypothetical protein
VFGQLPAAVRGRHPVTAAQLMSGQGAVEFWSGQLEVAAGAFAAAAAAPERRWERATSHGQLALAEAVRGRLTAAAAEGAAAAEAAAEGAAAGLAGPGPGGGPGPRRRWPWPWCTWNAMNRPPPAAR